MEIKALMSALLFFGCASDPVLSFVELQIATPSGAPVLQPSDEGTIQAWVVVGGATAERIIGEVREGSFDVRVPIHDASATWTIGVELELGDRKLLGVTPSFSPGETLGFVRLMVGEPASCATIVRAELDEPRASGHASSQGSFAPIFGGTDEPTAYEFLDLLRWEVSHDAEPAALDPLGEARTMRLSERLILVLSAGRGPFLFDLSNPGERVRSVELHEGADLGSTLLISPSGGGWVIGGGTPESPIQGLSYLDEAGAVQVSAMVRVRSEPAAVSLASGLLIVGGDRPTEGTVEHLSEGAEAGALVLEDLSLSDRWGAFALQGEVVAIVAGRDREGHPKESTLSIVGCPETCQVSEGEPWPNARAGFALTRAGQEAFLVGGIGDDSAASGLVERAYITGARLHVEAMSELVTPRVAPAAVSFGGGQVAIVGGRDELGGRRDIEVCFSQELRPLAF